MQVLFGAFGVIAFFVGLMVYTTSIRVLPDNAALLLMLIGAIIIAGAGIIRTAMGNSDPRKVKAD